MNHYFVVNAHAGKGNKVKKLIENINDACLKNNVTYTIYITQGIGDAEEYVKSICVEHENTDAICRFYACGGDGTINECLNGIADYPNNELAIIPIGTGNDFARNFGQAESFFDIEAQIKGVTTKCDVILYNGRYCMNVANIGLDCEVVTRTDIIKKNPLIPSKLAYICGLVGEFVKKSGVEFSYSVDGVKSEKKKFLLAFFANGGFYGGGFHAAPLAELKDGLMDICFINDVSRTTFLCLVGKYKKGTHLKIKNRDKIFKYFKCGKIELEFENKQRVCIDGEIQEYERLTIEILKDKINLSVPAVCAVAERDKAESVL